jgi:predicted TIM-barrel fold metal-dependent hydrolase
MSVTRREFVAQSAALSAAAVAATSSLAAEEPAAAKPSPVIDCHQHLWDLSKFKLPWLSADSPLNRTLVLKDYRQAIEGTGITRAVYMEVDVAPDQKQAEADNLIELCKSGQDLTVAGVLGGHPLGEGFRDYAKQFQGSPYVRGIRQVLHGGQTKPGTCLEKEFVESIRLLGQLDLSFDLCTRPAELADGVKLVDQCPDTQFILDHCGNGDVNAFLPQDRRGQKPSHDVGQWRRDIGALAGRKNVVCKISGIIARAPTGWSAADLAPIVNHCLDEFGPERVVFGGDWPVCLMGAKLAEWVAALRTIIADRPAAEQAKLLHDNAVTLYRLKPTTR